MIEAYIYIYINRVKGGFWEGMRWAKGGNEVGKGGNEVRRGGREGVNEDVWCNG
jgi:hypothetical protein